MIIKKFFVSLEKHYFVQTSWYFILIILVMHKSKKLSWQRVCDEYLAQKILKDISNWKTIDSIKTSYLNKLELLGLPNIYTLFNKFLNKNLKEDLLNLTLLSRSSKEIDLACSNAITILAKSDFSFKNINFSNIRIPKADLSQCLFIKVNFEGSDLKEVKFLQSHIINVNFKNCDLSNAKFGLAMKINSQKGKGLSFSANDDHFYYKTDDILMEVNLKNQESKIKADLREFISSKIIRIHSTKLNPVISMTHGQYIKFWDEYEKKHLFEINTIKLEISQNWKFIAAHDNKSFVRCWDIENSHQILGPFNKIPYKWGQLVFSPSSKYFAIKKSTIIYIIETENWTLIRSVWGKFSAKGVIAISSCGRKIAYSENALLYLIDAVSSHQTKIFSRNKKIQALSFSPCGQFLAFGSNEGAGYIMCLENQRILQIFTHSKQKLVSVLFSTSSKYISWTNSQGDIWVYDFFPKFLKNDNKLHFLVSNVKVSPKGTYLLIFGTKKAILWDLTDFNPKQIEQLAFNSFYADYAFSPFETYLARRIYKAFDIYHLKSGMWVKTIITQDYIYDFTFSNCESYFICLNWYTYEYHRIPYLDKVRVVETKIQSSNHIKFTSKYDFRFDPQCFLYIWDLEKEYFIKKIHIEQRPYIYAIEPICSKFAFLVSAQRKTYIRILSINTEESVYIESHENIASLCFSPNGTALIWGNDKGIINIWDIKTQTVKEKIRSLFLKSIDSVEAVNGHIIIRENDNIEIFKTVQLDESF
ncbi:unnamed protein product [Blepharisma stoltei]|uniref:Anaphase-promoting complex subunit 4 WD40 domain-containing protein n=1 Tax=Blepharisma stoltei TaxID=1481888 RepID=A0AAU9JCC0_9CILI|nr:unnamed protein product [Blepharisma stoltei]